MFIFVLVDFQLVHPVHLVVKAQNLYLFTLIETMLLLLKEIFQFSVLLLNIDLAVVVLAPEIKACRRNNPCKQIIRYIEQSAFIDVSETQTIQLQICDLIAADNDLVYFIRINTCDCDIEELKASVLSAKDKITATHNGDDIELIIYVAESFLIHLRRSGRQPLGRA